MTSWWPALVLLAIVGMLLIVSARPEAHAVFRWLPIPLWCYGVPMILNAIGWLPAQADSYGWITNQLFPVALGLLLLGVDLPAMAKVGTQALAAMAIGATGIVLSGPLMFWIVQGHLPAEAWKGIGTLAATWTGGSLNMLALRTILSVPDAVFAPLVAVDAIVAYSWMAGLVACKGLTPILNRWLGASEPSQMIDAASSTPHTPARRWDYPLICLAIAVGLVWVCRWLTRPLPVGGIVSSTTGWTVLLVTTVALGSSMVPWVRRLGQHGASLGYPCLYLVLAALGAQASVRALAATPIWLVVGFGCVAVHALALLAAGRVLHLPLGILATASQANVGGVVSAPLVGAVYHRALAPVGLLLAIAGNAIGTYLGLVSATICRWLR